ncbi:MAG: fructose-6-phosphate aldolase [Candidatus Micrarchaeota archaeon]|nr:fructose-6-phosphate aldolase [Candidatus Micrarchaeota archaeon]
MKIFLDTADVDKIRALAATGLVDGVTTNPTLIMKGGRDHKQAIQEICKIVHGPVSVEGVGETAEELVKDAREFSRWAPNVVAKVPMTAEGLKAVKILEKEGIPTNVTLVFSASQAYLVGKAGATYCSPFVGRLDDVSENGMAMIAEVVQIYKNYGYKTQVLVASVRSPMHVVESAKLGAHVVTLPPDIFEKLFKHPLTDRGITQFLADHEKAVAAAGKR